MSVTYGVVSAFDDRRGIGEITAADGTVFAFHCVAIADGTRTVDHGTSVSFVVRPGHRGQLEALDIVTSAPAVPRT